MSIWSARRRGATIRALGLVIAGLTGAAAVALIGWSVLRAGATSAPEQAPPVDIAPAPERTPPTSAPPMAIENITDLVDTADKGHVELVDEENRVIQELFYESFSPQESGRFFVQSPRAWVYLDNGRTVFITADSLRYLQPAGAREPESGRFEGGVEMRVFAPVGDAGVSLRARDVDEDNPPPPVLTVQMESMNFDSGIGELSTVDNVRVDAVGVTASFDGLTIVIDEQRRRLAYLRTVGNGRVSVRPEDLRNDDQRRAVANGDTGADSSAPDEDALRQPYRAEFSNAVRVRAGELDLRADMLEAWALLLDGRMPSDAIAPLRASAGQSAGGSGGGAPDSAPDADDIEEVLVTWSGPLTIRPLDSAPDELARDYLAVRFNANTGGAVALTDDASGASLRASAIGYGLTSRALLLDGAGPRGVAMRAPEQGELLTSRVEIDLTTGQGAIPGPGVVRTIATQASEERSISWQERADFVLATADNQVDFSSSWPLEEAIFRGDAVGVAPGATVQGEFIRSLFVERAAGGPGLSRVIVEGGARADAGADGRLSARRVDVEFDPEADADSPTPRLLTAEGRVRAERAGDALEAELVEAQFVADGERVRVANLRADLDVRITTADGERITADDLRADLDAGIFDLNGRAVTLASSGASLEGTSMRIEEGPERLTVFGAGALRYARTEATDSPYANALLTWTESMTYDGVQGIAEFIGQCDAMAQTDDFGRDGAKAHRMVVALLQADEDLNDRRATGLDGALQRVQLFSATHDGAGEGDAEFESRRYRADADAPGGVRLESLVFLSSTQIDADVAADTLTVPAPGRLLFEDRRASRDPEADDDRNAISTRGTTLFEWDGALEMNRGTGEAEMSRAVRLRHLPPGGDEAAELESERLTASVVLPDADDGVARLLSAEASGAVYLRRGSRQMIADRLLYDAPSGVAEALAAPGNAVTVFDINQPTPLTGSVLRWDLVRDRLEWRDAGETSAPR